MKWHDIKRTLAMLTHSRTNTNVQLRHDYTEYMITYDTGKIINDRGNHYPYPYIGQYFTKTVLNFELRLRTICILTQQIKKSSIDFA